MQDWRSRGLINTAYGNLHRLNLTRARAFTGASRLLLAREPAVPYRASISRLALAGEIVPLLTRNDIGALPAKYRGPHEISWGKHPGRAIQLSLKVSHRQ